VWSQIGGFFKYNLVRRRGNRKASSAYIALSSTLANISDPRMNLKSSTNPAPAGSYKAQTPPSQDGVYGE
jgi:hypothetical protein